VIFVRTDISEERISSIIRVKRISELGTANVPTSLILFTLMIETSVLTKATGRNIPEDGILHSHRRENLNSYMPLLCHTSHVFVCSSLHFVADIGMRDPLIEGHAVFSFSLDEVRNKAFIRYMAFFPFVRTLTVFSEDNFL
jgi:hypothetical protein